MNTLEVRFRNATISDISNIMKIEYASFHHTICENEAAFTERINTFPDGFRVMELDGQIIGYISSELWETTHSFSKELFTLGHSIKERHKQYGREIYISSMGLDPTYRSLGLGKFMFDAFVKHITARFTTVESIILIVSEKWDKARKIYRRNGFRQIGILDRFFVYRHEKPYYENAIIMRKDLYRHKIN